MRLPLRSVLLMAALAACSRPGGEVRRTASVRSADTATRSMHDMAGMPDSGRVGAAAPTPMAGMSHATGAGDGHGASPGGGMAGMHHGAAHAGDAMTGMTHPGGASGMAGMDHSAGGMAPRRHGVTGAMAHTGQMPMPSGHAETRGGHDAHGAMPASHGGMPGMRDAAPGQRMHAHPSMPGMGVPPDSPATDSADAKLLRLTAELVRDPAVRERIQADSALRRRWEDPAVRRAIDDIDP